MGDEEGGWGWGGVGGRGWEEKVVENKEVVGNEKRIVGWIGISCECGAGGSRREGEDMKYRNRGRYPKRMGWEFGK